MHEIAANAKKSPNHDHPQSCRANSEPDVVGYLKHSISEIIKESSADSAVRISENGAENLTGEGCDQNKNAFQNGSNSARIGCLFKAGVGSGLPVTENERLKGYIKDSAQLMIREVDEVTEEVLQVCRMRTSLKRRRSRAAVLPKNEDRGKTNKKQRMLFLARSEAAHRRRMTDVFRECGSILKQAIKRPADLRSVQDRMEAEDGSGYSNVREICEDVRLVFRNAMSYNPSETYVHKFAKALLEKFEEKWRTVLEPKLVELEVIREEEQGHSDVGDLASEIAAKKYSDEVFKKLRNIEEYLEEFLRATTSKCRPMSMMEKEELVRRIRRLPPNGLNRVIDIIAQGKTSLDVSAEEIPIDLDKTDPATLWRLYFYCEVASPSVSVDSG